MDSPLYRLLVAHFDDFEQAYGERFVRDYGFYRPVISDVVRAYLECGDLKQGFARVRCPDCHHEFLLAFSCRGRWFCPSCHTKKVIQFGEVIWENILYPVPHRQYVFSIPIILRKFFLYNRDFSVDNSVCIGRADEAGITNLAQYIIRSPFSTSKISYNDATGMVVYRSKMTHGNNKKNFKIFPAEKFIAAITQHIPDKNFSARQILWLVFKSDAWGARETGGGRGGDGKNK